LRKLRRLENELADKREEIADEDDRKRRARLIRQEDRIREDIDEARSDIADLGEADADDEEDDDRDRRKKRGKSKSKSKSSSDEESSTDEEDDEDDDDDDEDDDDDDDRQVIRPQSDHWLNRTMSGRRK
jgi:hypothetical protein